MYFCGIHDTWIVIYFCGIYDTWVVMCFCEIHDTLVVMHFSGIHDTWVAAYFIDHYLQVCHNAHKQYTKQLGAIHNCQRLNKTYTFSRRGVNESMLIPYTFNILTFFFFHFHDKCSIWKPLVCTLLRGVWESVYILYNCLNVDNYGRPRIGLYIVYLKLDLSHVFMKLLTYM